MVLKHLRGVQSGLPHRIFGAGFEAFSLDVGVVFHSSLKLFLEPWEVHFPQQFKAVFEALGGCLEKYFPKALQSTFWSGFGALRGDPF